MQKEIHSRKFYAYEISGRAGQIGFRSVKMTLMALQICWARGAGTSTITWRTAKQRPSLVSGLLDTLLWLDPETQSLSRLSAPRHWGLDGCRMKQKNTMSS